MKTLLLSVFAILFAMNGICQTTGTGTGSSAGTQSSNNQQTIKKPPHHNMHSTSTVHNSRINATNSRNNGLNQKGVKSTTTSTSHRATLASKTVKGDTSGNRTHVHSSNRSTNEADSTRR